MIASLPEPSLWRSEKIRPHHLERLAVVYVRQSTLQQVLDHQESTRLQYALKGHALALGWPQERVLIIDDDLGKSGRSTEGRQGFQRLVAEVGLNHVGLILGIEMSRLARSNKDWHGLLEVCALFKTLIADQDGVYDPAHVADRMLLGLTGMMSEAELQLIKQRMQQGKLNKARRGELRLPMPVGYLERPSGEVVFDPDEGVRSVVRLIFSKFEALGSLHALLRYLVKQGVLIGIRERTGAAKGEVSWRRPNRMTLQCILTHPMYAGAYVYGRRQTDARKQQPNRRSTGRVVKHPSDWHVLIKDHYPAYISWEAFEQNQARLRANRPWGGEKGALRNGPALLPGLLICGRCGCRMVVSYSGSPGSYRYGCSRQVTDYGLEPCQSLAGQTLDAFVSQQVLLALAPATLALSLQAAEQLERGRMELDQLWRQRLERATFEADRAARHYRHVEPENRLVARQLAREWEEKLLVQRQLSEDHERFLREQPRTLSREERQGIENLAQDIPMLWEAATTTPADRQEIIRQLIEGVQVNIEGESERVRLEIEWMGGARTQELMIRSVARLEQLSYYPELCERIRSLAAQGCRAEKIARILTEEGFKPPKRYERFARQGITRLLHQLGVYKPRFSRTRRSPLKTHEWYLMDLAVHLGMPKVTLYNWISRGWVEAYQQPHDCRRWVICANSDEVARLKRLYQDNIRYRRQTRA